MAFAYTKRKIKKLKKRIAKFFYNLRRKIVKRFVKRRDFSVISNNCWAGRVYQYLDMPYLSPTAGLYFFAPDYIRFVSNLKHYLGCKLEFIKPEDSKYYELLKERNQLSVPVALLDDVEIIFLHYKTPKEAAEKWYRRASRVNYDNIIIKLSRMNLCTEKEMAEFAELQFDNKILINNRKDKKYDCEIYAPLPSDEYGIINDTQPFPGKVNIIKILNKKPVRYPDGGLK